eukprot:COSAG05_NODE_12526_length_464_cov_1.126027_2_plen_44_part_01
MYFSWLGHYTRSLGVSSMFGLIVFAAQPYFTDVDGNSGPDQNPL